MQLAPGGRALLLGLQPQRLVGLVPDQVAVGDAAIAAGHRLGELAELRRVRLIARVAQRRHAAGPERSGAGDGQQRGHAVGDDERDGLIGRGPVVERVVGVARVEAQRLRRVQLARRDRDPADLDAHRVDPGGGPAGDDLGRPLGRVDQDAVVGDAGLQLWRGGGGGHEGHDEERGREDGAHGGEGQAKPRPEGSSRLRVSAQGAEPAAGGRSRPRDHRGYLAAAYRSATLAQLTTFHHALR